MRQNTAFITARLHDKAHPHTHKRTQRDNGSRGSPNNPHPGCSQLNPREHQHPISTSPEEHRTHWGSWEAPLQTSWGATPLPGHGCMSEGMIPSQGQTGAAGGWARRARRSLGQLPLWKQRGQMWGLLSSWLCLSHGLTNSCSRDAALGAWMSTVQQTGRLGPRGSY